MADAEHLARLREGVTRWNKWRAEDFTLEPDLQGASLRGEDLTGANLDNADLTGADLTTVNLAQASLGMASLARANLSGTNLFRAELSGADLTEAFLFKTDLVRATTFKANLSGACLVQADLSRADVTGANLRRADLSNAVLAWTNFNGATLSEANLHEALMLHTVFPDNDLSEVMGLATTKHVGPSTIGIDTIYNSKGKIPESFLREAGVPSIFIEYMRSLAATPIEYYSCFISYSTRDQEFADRLHSYLQGRGVRCWFAPHDVQGGKKLHEQIDDAIRRYDKLLLVLSSHSMNSEWVKTEIAKARRRETQENRRMLFPVSLVPFRMLEDWECFDADIGKDAAREIREYYVPDFTNWENHKSFKEAFDRLLRDLKAENLKKN